MIMRPVSLFLLAKIHDEKNKNNCRYTGEVKGDLLQIESTY